MRLRDTQEFRTQVLAAAQKCLEEGVRITVKSLRMHGARGNERKLYQMRHELTLNGDLPADTTRSAHRIHRFNARTTPKPSLYRRRKQHMFTAQMVKLYGKKKMLQQYRREA